MFFRTAAVVLGLVSGMRPNSPSAQLREAHPHNHINADHRAQLIDSAISAWQSSDQPIGLREFAASFAPVVESGACDNEGLEDQIDNHLGDESGSLLRQLWMCGDGVPARVVCSRPARTFGIELILAYRVKGLGLSVFLSDFGATGIIALVDQCNADDREASVYSVLSLFAEIKRIYRFTDTALRPAIAGLDGLDYFCGVNKDLLEARSEDAGSIVHILCPNILRSLESLYRVIGAAPKPRPKPVRISRDHAFSEALPLLTDMFVEADVPSGILFDDEAEVSPGSVQEWLRLAGQEAAHILFSEDGTEMKPDLPDSVYYAFGRLMALSIRNEGEINMKFPENFFRELLTRHEVLPGTQMGPIDHMRQGLEYFYPVSRILEMVNPDEFRLLFTTTA